MNWILLLRLVREGKGKGEGGVGGLTFLGLVSLKM